MKSILIFSLFLAYAACCAQSIPDSIRTTIEHGDFTAAQRAMKLLIDSPRTSQTQALALKFEIERLDRIRKDFRNTEADVLKSLGATFQDVLGIAGGAILGDGRVGLILDLPTLVGGAVHAA